MKKAVPIMLTVLMLSSALASLSFFVEPVQAQSQTIVSTELINFYSMTSSEAQTFLNTIHNQDIPTLTIRLNAMTEFTTGTSPGITKAKEIITSANQRGIQVAVDLHTWFTTWDNYFRDSAPDSSSYRNQYITYVRNVLTAFSSSNVYAFMVMNEPQARTATSSENQFILNVIAEANKVTSKPISIRFMGGYSPSTGHYSSQIDAASDFLCRNSYWDPRNPSSSVYGCTEAKLETAISSAHNQGKKLWITEFGKTKINLEEQKAYVKAFVTWAKTNKADQIYCWVSQPESGTSETYNIFNAYTPNPAFYELTNTQTTTPTPIPTPTTTPTPTSTPTTQSLLLDDGFESRSFSLWSGTTTSRGETATISTIRPYEGSYGAKFTTSGNYYGTDYAYLYKRTDIEEAYATGKFYITQTSSTSSQMLKDNGDKFYLIKFSDESGAQYMAGIIRESGTCKWMLYADGSYKTTSTAVMTNKWYTVELQWNAARTLEMVVDGKEILEMNLSSYSKADISVIQLGIISATKVQDGLTVYGDNFKIIQ